MNQNIPYLPSFRFGLTAVVVFVMTACIGCERPEDPMLKILEASSSKKRIEDLSRTMDFAFNERQFEQKEVENSVSLGLNRWASYSADRFEEAQWETDATAADLPESFSRLQQLQLVGDSTFLASDALYLQSSVWCAQIADRVVANSLPGQFELYRLMADEFEADEDDEDPVSSLVAKLHPKLEAKQSTRLATALKLFDWTSRNIQLEPTPTYDEDEIDDLRLMEGDSLVQSGIAEPGTRRQPWHVLIFGRGDYIERAKLFMTLCHHADLPTVMLATQQDDTVTPWAVGVAIDGELYLFDTRMGLPIPGPDGSIVATLSDVQNDPSLISGLDLTVKESLAENTKYWVVEKDLKSLAGLVYWPTEGVAKRMATLEQNLVGDLRLLLIHRADKTAEALPKIEGLEYRGWDIAARTQQYRKVLGESLPKAISDDTLSQKLTWYYDEEDYVIRFPHYRTSRARFFKGKFEKSEGLQWTRDAIESFAVLMYSDQTINMLKTDKMLQLQLGIYRDNQNAAQFAGEIANRQKLMRLVRRDMGVFMVQSHYDNGSMSTAANWLPTLLEESDSERWRPGLSYLYGRALESRHEYFKAIEALKAEGPQQHGNLIRARLLQKQIDTRFADVKKRMEEAQ